MNRTDFQRAPLKEQVFRVLESGKTISDRRFLYFHIKLYALYDFFVELWYIPTVNKIDRVETLGIDEVLDIYSSSFNISDLLK